MLPTDFYDGVDLPNGFDKKLVEAAFLYANNAHKNQKRKSGEDYIIHPLSVAKIVLSLVPDASMVAAALLHDTVEDTDTTTKSLEENFGKDVADLVHAVTNLGKVDFSAYSKPEELAEAKQVQKNENLRELFLAMSEDARVVIIKLADRLHNMQTIKYLPKEDQIRISRETLNIFAPLALRLGIGEIKGELEDLAFPIAFPEEYKKLKKEANRRYKAADRYVITIKRLIDDKLKDDGIDAEVQGRAKHIYSLYKKITRPEINWDFGKIYDLVALRILAENVSDCYRILGLIHSMFRPMPDYIRDYIAAPKPNGYRSIHTSVFGPEGKIVEIQIRTHEMHEEAEFGVASHLHYTEQKTAGKGDAELARGTFADKTQTDFLKQIKAWQNSAGNTDDFLEGLKIEFLNDRIYVFSPRGDIYDLPASATPVDFAYEVHSKIGDSCTGAKVNGKIVPLDSQLKTRDVIEIITAKKATPKRDWLDFVKTAKAKQHIRSYFRKLTFENSKEEGQKVVLDEIELLGVKLDSIPEAEIRSALSVTSFKAIDDLFASVGSGLTTPRQAVRIILGRSYIPEPIVRQAESKIPVKPIDFNGMKVAIAPCCNPEKDDEVICYVTRGRGLTAHTGTCPNLKSLEKERLFYYNPWIAEKFRLHLEVIGLDRVGMLRDITTVVSAANVNIDQITSRHEKNKTFFDLLATVEDIDQARNVMRELSLVKDVSGVKRLNK